MPKRLHGSSTSGPATAGPLARLRARLAASLRPGGDDDHVVAETPEVSLREVMRRFWPDARPFRRWIPVTLALIALGALISTAEIWIFKLVVDDVLIPGDLGALVPLIGAYVGLLLIGGLVSFGDDMLSTWLAERFLLSLRLRIFSHMGTLSPDVFDSHRSGDLVSRVTGDVNSIEGLVLSGLADGLAAVLRIAFFAGALLILDWQLALVVLVVGPCFWWVAKRFASLIKAASRERNRRSGSLGALAEEGFANSTLVQATNTQAASLARFRRQNEGVIEAELAATRIRGLFSPLVDAIELVAILAVFAFGTLRVASGDISVGGLLVFAAYMSQLMSPIQELGSLSNYWFRALAGAERVIELLDVRPRVSDAPNARPLRAARPSLAFEAVSFGYPGSPTPALSGVDLRIEQGETVALVGASGAGKSTVSKLALRFYDPDSGRVTLDGEDLRELTLSSVRDTVSLLAQDAPLLHASIYDNIAMARPEAGRERVEAAARAAGAHEFVGALPDGYATDVGERGRRLSGGQRQRVAIARALLVDAPVVILDEPTTGLDVDARRAISEPLGRLASSRATLIVTHDLELAAEADRIVVLEAGRVVESGTPGELLSGGGAYAALRRRGVFDSPPREPAAPEAVA